MCSTKTWDYHQQNLQRSFTSSAWGYRSCKEDHNIGNQKFAVFKERIKACADALHDANQKSGFKSLYIPNISGPVTEILERAAFAKEAGANGVMIIPGLVGLDFIRVLAEDDAFGLPIMHHPALHGTYVLNPIQGFSFGCWYGQIPRWQALILQFILILAPFFLSREEFNKSLNNVLRWDICAPFSQPRAAE